MSFVTHVMWNMVKYIHRLWFLSIILFVMIYFSFNTSNFTFCSRDRLVKIVPICFDSFCSPQKICTLLVLACSPWAFTIPLVRIYDVNSIAKRHYMRRQCWTWPAISCLNKLYFQCHTCKGQCHTVCTVVCGSEHGLKHSDGKVNNQFRKKEIADGFLWSVCRMMCAGKRDAGVQLQFETNSFNSQTSFNTCARVVSFLLSTIMNGICWASIDDEEVGRAPLGRTDWSHIPKSSDTDQIYDHECK